MSRRTDLAADKKAERKIENEKKNRRALLAKQLKILGIVVGAAAVCALVIIGINALVTSVKTNNGSYIRSSVIAKGGDRTVDGAMMAFYIGEKYDLMLGKNTEEDLHVLGIDTSKKLNEQSYDGTATWFDKLASDACDSVAVWLEYCSAADKAGFALSDSDISAIGERVDRIDYSAYPVGMSRDDAVKALELEVLAEKYKAYLCAENTASAEDVEKYVSEHKGDYFAVDYRYYYIGYEVSEGSLPEISGEEGASDASAAESTPEESSEVSAATDESVEDVSEESSEEVVILEESDAKEEIAKLASAKSEQEFIDKIYDFIIGHFTTETADTAKEKAPLYIQENVTGLTDELGTWMYSSDRALYDTTILDSPENGTCAAVMITSLPEFDAGYDNARIRYISVRDSATAEKVAALAEGADEDTFARLALIYSNDASSRFTGGLYGSYKSGTIKNEELNTWIFGGASAGDTMTAEGNNAWYVVMYCGAGSGEIKSKVAGEISADAIQKAYTAAESTVRVSIDKTSLSLINY